MNVLNYDINDCYTYVKNPVTNKKNSYLYTYFRLSVYITYILMELLSFSAEMTSCLP